MSRTVVGDEIVCPNCGAMLNMNVDIGGGFLYDVCLGCGYKRKKNLDGQEVELDTPKSR